MTEPTPDDTYIARLMRRFAAAPDRVVLVADGRSLAAGAVAATIARYARALEGLGIGRGDLVALFAPTTPEAIAVRYAANLVGAAASYLSAPPTEGARKKLIEDVDPTLLVAFGETVALVPAGTKAPLASVGADIGATRLDALADAASDAPLACAARSGDLAVVVSSGGSTGVPKGSVRDFARYTAMVAAPSPDDRRQLVNGRLAYLSQALVDMTLLGGGTVVLDDAGFDAARTLAAIEADRITDLFLVEPQLFELMDHPDVARRDLTSLWTLSHVGASAPATLRRRAHARLGPALAHTYGASEEGLVSILAPPDYALPDRWTTAGKVLPGVEVRLRRADGTLAGTDEPGTIEVRSAATATGYRNRPDLAAAAFSDGWYASGDLGVLRGDGILSILGRAADMARGDDGSAVGPTQVEDTLCALPAVRYAVVVVDPEAGRWVAAVERWPEGAAPDPAALTEAVAAEHGGDVAGRLVVVEVTSVPRTEQGKPERETIRALGRAELAG